MTTARHSILVLLAVALAVLAVLPPAGATGTKALPRPGPLNPAFVDALHDPLVKLGIGRLPSPVEVHVGAAAEAKAARLAETPSFDLRAEGRLTAVKDQGRWNTCWAFANIAAEHTRNLHTLEGSGLDWTLMCPIDLVDAPPGRARWVFEDLPEGPHTGYADLADAIVTMLDRPDAHGRRVGVVSAPSP